MKTLLIAICTVLAGMTIACSDGTTSVVPADDSIVGRWTLVRISGGLTGMSQSPADAGYSETLEFMANGTFKRSVTRQSGLQEKTGKFYTSENPTKTAEKQAIIYPDENMVQSYSFRDGRLLLYELTPKGATLADGLTYEYTKQ